MLTTFISFHGPPIHPFPPEFQTLRLPQPLLSGALSGLPAPPVLPPSPSGFLLTVATNVAAAPWAAVQQQEAEEQPEPPGAPRPQQVLHPPHLGALAPLLSRRESRDSSRRS